MKSIDIDNVCLPPHASIREAMVCINTNSCGVALLVDSHRKLLGTITDGDIRRAILAGQDLDKPASELLINRAPNYVAPITAWVGTSPDELLKLMQEKVVHQIPLLNENQQVVELATIENLIPSYQLGVHAVIMAGGFGKRLRPLTEDTPKPMLPVGGRPLMELLLEQLRDSGIRNVSVTTHFRPEKISEYFGDGKRFGVELSYINEEHPLGTGGALGLLAKPSDPLLVINGDVLTQVNFRAMYAFHREYDADITLAVRQYGFEVPYGVVERDGVFVKSIQEKPFLNFFVNAGIYLLQPTVYDYIPSGKGFNMTDLLQWLMDDGRKVLSFPVREYWLDIGQHADYVRAQKDVEDGVMKNKSIS
jgi:dTDP-glucose pyrophosphorylase/CBS domain-containing protein